MWICQNNAFLSVVEPSSRDPKAAGGDFLLVRARVRGHIEAVFPEFKGIEVPGRDYQFRAYIPREAVAKQMFASVMAIKYGNFKDSVRNDELHHAYAKVWGVMANLQEIPPYETQPRKRVPASKRASVY